MAVPLENRSDCTRCAALCCIAYPSQDMPGFAAAKDAGEACPKLANDGQCTIYANRADQGFAGCIRFECSTSCSICSRSRTGEASLR